MASFHDGNKDTIISDGNQATIKTPDLAFSYSPTTGTFKDTSKNTATQANLDSLHSFGLSGLHDQLSPPFSIPRTPLFLSSHLSPSFGSPEFQSNFVSTYRSTLSGLALTGLSPNADHGLSSSNLERARRIKRDDASPDLTTKRATNLTRPSTLDSSTTYLDFSPLKSPADFEMLDAQLDSNRTFSQFPHFAVPFATPFPLQEGFVADINMFDKEDKHDDLFVRPQDLLGELPQQLNGDKSPSRVTESASPYNASPVMVTHPPDDQHSCHRDCLDQLPLLVEQYLKRFAPPVANAPPDNGYLTTPLPPGDSSKLLPYSPISSELLAAVEGPRSRSNAVVVPEPKMFSDIKNTVKAHFNRETEPKVLKSQDNSTNLLHLCNAPVPEDVVIDKAHEGISGELVAQKTKYFMMMHPGSRLSEELLFTFAGRLSVSGEQIAGYRCYIEGCLKATKRKDHMGDHVRTHLGEKPYLCRVCGMGFIRNNDCLRHENNHKPEKRFICDCGAAFSRRDLYVRHQKTACSAAGAGTQPPKRAGKAARGVTSNRKRDSTPDGDDADDVDYVPGNSRMY